MSRTAVIAALLRHPQPVREPLGIELRGSLVQLLAPGTTVPTWQASPELLAAAIDSALQKDTPVGTQPSGATSTARAEILAVLLDAGYNKAAAAELLSRADREPHDPEPNSDFLETLAGGHALVIEYGDCEVHGTCQCGRRIGSTTPDASLDTFVDGWERHTHTEVGHD
ncbi:hypothetical protein [Streptomyces sp. NPDC005732]|uniref:hypothetical protein n=1 Tax=Streptomyces sp. NPDC005732 TaxID=3157057 RepID=UPI00340DBCA1